MLSSLIDKQYWIKKSSSSFEHLMIDTKNTRSCKTHEQ